MLKQLQEAGYIKKVDHCGTCAHFRSQVYFLEEPGTGKIRRSNHKCTLHKATVSIHGLCKSFKEK